MSSINFIDVYLFPITDESCSVFYGPDKHSPLKLGVCDVGSPSCKCSQGKTEYIKINIVSLPKKASTGYISSCVCPYVTV